MNEKPTTTSSDARSSSSSASQANAQPGVGPNPVDLERDFGLSVSSLVAHPGGFESEGWVADGTWFVKVWRQELSPAAPDPVPGRLGMLRELRKLGLPVPAPVPTLSGSLHAIWNARPYAVFPYIHGRPAADTDWRQSARALRQVHDAIPPSALGEMDKATSSSDAPPPSDLGPTAAPVSAPGPASALRRASGLGEHQDASAVLALPVGSFDESDVHQLAARLDHPWVADRSDELAAAIDRLDDAVRRAEWSPARRVLCHTDFISLNLIVDSDDRIAAILDWDQAVLAPREHDLWIAAETRHLEGYLTEYGAQDLNLDQLEYALLSRALRDLTARVLGEVDRPGVQTWGFDRLARLDDDLARFRPFCTGS